MHCFKISFFIVVFVFRFPPFARPNEMMISPFGDIKGFAKELIKDLIINDKKRFR